MKRCIALFLSLCLIPALLAGCGGQPEPSAVAPAETAEPIHTVPDATAEHEAPLYPAYPWLPETLAYEPELTVCWDEMLELLESVIAYCDPTVVEAWQAVLVPKTVRMEMERDDGMLALYEAACVLGIGNTAPHNQREIEAHYSNHLDPSDRYYPYAGVFNNLKSSAPYEDSPGHPVGRNYITCAQLYAMGNSSAASTEGFFDYNDSDTRYDDPLTRREAIAATAKLVEAYETAHGGGYSIPATNWDDPLLAEAAAAREAILNSPTVITKGAELVLGETYTGTAYYISNTGDDSRDGRSPETAWASLEKVEKTRLNYGDAVFFERGGKWHGFLQMQYGVSYSAYGEGAKPIITGAAPDAARPEKWVLYGETDDGGLIWQYTEKLEDVGVILLDGGEFVAQKSYPMWNGREYVNCNGELYEVEKELADLMYVSILELQGEKMQIAAPLLDCGVTGALYLRCDAGNPGELYDQIEMAVMPTATKTGRQGYNVLDNIHFRCYSGSGVGTNNKSNIVCQNCEIDWCGGGLASYGNIWWSPDAACAFISGGGLLLFGTELTGVNNYIHDCESKGIGIVVNPSKEWLNQSGILAEGNVVERCGTSALLSVREPAIGMGLKFENIRFIANYFVNGCYGWRQMNIRQPLTIDAAQMLSFENVWPTGEVLFENNLFYRAAGPLVNRQGENMHNGSVLPTMRGNTYVQDAGQMLYVMQDYQSGFYPETTMATSDQALMEQCVREYMGDSTGTVIILDE